MIFSFTIIVRFSSLSSVLKKVCSINTLKRRYSIPILMLFGVIFGNLKVNSQSLSPLEISQSNTAQILRTFQNKVIYSPTYFPTLQQNTSRLINISKSLENFNELTQLQNYFLIATDYYLKAADTTERSIILGNINKDLTLKIQAVDSSLQLATSSYFGKDYVIMITAYINGVRQDNGYYRVFWGTFLGKNQESLIKANKFQGSSNNFSNPYYLSIKLPGYISFWLQDATTSVFYKSSEPYKIMTEKDVKLDINFIPFK